MNVQYDAILAKKIPIICGVIVQVFRCALINRPRRSDLLEVQRLIAAEMLQIYVWLTVHNPDKGSGPL